MRGEHYCGGGIHRDNDTWWVRVWKPVAGYKDAHMASYFVQMAGDDINPFMRMLDRAKRKGEIKDYALQHIDHFWSIKEFEKKTMQRVRKKK
jgi:hypothetical protein